jgi:hypothetical protein
MALLIVVKLSNSFIDVHTITLKRVGQIGLGLNLLEGGMCKYFC